MGGCRAGLCDRRSTTLCWAQTFPASSVKDSIDPLNTAIGNNHKSIWYLCENIFKEGYVCEVQETPEWMGGKGKHMRRHNWRYRREDLRNEGETELYKWK